MKNTIKATLIALVVAGATASVQAASYTGDLIIGFTVQSGNDFEFDLGTAGSLTDGETWDLSSLLGAQSLNTSAVKWGVIGAQLVGTTRTAYQTKVSGLPNTVLSQAAFNTIFSQIGGIYGLFPGTGGPGSNVAVADSNTSSWGKHTIVGGTGTWLGTGGRSNPNQTGYTSVDFYGNVANGSAATLLGSFSFADTGIVTFDAVSVPEPSTYGLFAGAGLLAVCLRNQFRRKQA